MKKSKDRIKDNPKKEEELGFIGQFPLGWKVLEPKKTKFDEFIDKAYEHGLIGDEARFLIEYYKTMEDNEKQG